MKYKLGIVGGTFDHLHLGHKKLLATAFAESEKVLVGIITEKLYKNKLLAESIEPFEIRENEIKKYLVEKGILKKATFVKLKDIYGPSLQNKTIDAIFVTKTTLQMQKK